MNTIGGYNSITHGESTLQGARLSADQGKFQTLLEEMNQKDDTASNISSEQVTDRGRLNGDYGSDFSQSFSLPADKKAAPVGAAANQANPNVKTKTIDRTSELYKKSLQMESYLVKMMLSSMRKTIVHADGENNYERSMYEDMLYDEYATKMTEKAGFGLADEMYLQLSSQQS